MEMSASLPPRELKGNQLGDRIFSSGLLLCALVAIVAFVALTFVLVNYSRQSLSQFGLSFITTADWDPAAKQVFGAASYIFGTVVTSLVALLVATPLAIGSALFVSEYAPRK